MRQLVNGFRHSSVSLSPGASMVRLRYLYLNAWARSALCPSSVFLVLTFALRFSHRAHAAECNLLGAISFSSLRSPMPVCSNLPLCPDATRNALSSSASVETLCEEQGRGCHDLFVSETKKSMKDADIFRWLKVFEEGLPGHPPMRASTACLDFSRNQLTQNGVSRLLESFLLSGITIRILHLERNKICTSCAICDFFSHQGCCLEELYLGGNPMSLDTCWKLVFTGCTTKDAFGSFKYPLPQGKSLWMHFTENKQVTQEAMADKFLSCEHSRPIPEMVKIEDPSWCCADNGTTVPTSATLAAVHVVCNSIVRHPLHVQRTKSKPRRRVCTHAQQIPVYSREDPWGEMAAKSDRLRPVSFRNQNGRLEQQCERRPSTARPKLDRGSDGPTQQQGPQHLPAEDASAPTQAAAASSEAGGFPKQEHLNNVNFKEVPPILREAEQTQDDGVAPAARPTADVCETGACTSLRRLQLKLLQDRQCQQLKYGQLLWQQFKPTISTRLLTALTCQHVLARIVAEGPFGGLRPTIHVVAVADYSAESARQLSVTKGTSLIVVMFEPHPDYVLAYPLPVDLANVGWLPLSILRRRYKDTTSCRYWVELKVGAEWCWEDDIMLS